MCLTNLEFLALIKQYNPQKFPVNQFPLHWNFTKVTSHRMYGRNLITYTLDDLHNTLHSIMASGVSDIQLVTTIKPKYQINSSYSFRPIEINCNNFVDMFEIQSGVYALRGKIAYQNYQFSEIKADRGFTPAKEVWVVVFDDTTEEPGSYFFCEGMNLKGELIQDNVRERLTPVFSTKDQENIQQNLETQFGTEKQLALV
jgi:hypothetical protein